MPTARRFTTAVAAAGLLMLALSVGTALAASSVSITETNERYAFHPGTLTVALGDRVTWTNKSDVAHTVDADDGSFKSGDFTEDQTFQHTFTTAGTVKYHCAIHTYMVATVVVLAAGLTPPPTDTAPIGADGHDRSTPLVLLGFGAGLLAMTFVLRRRSRAA